MNSGVIYYKAKIEIATLSTALEEFTLRLGIADNQSGDVASGVYIEYDRTASVNWRLRSAVFTSRTNVVSGVVVATGSHILEIMVAANGASAEAWVDGVSLGTVSATMPSGQTLSAVGRIQKSVGTTARILLVDYVKAWQHLTTPRS